MTEHRIDVPAREGRAVRVEAGRSFRVVDVDGGQVGDLFAFCLDDLGEYLSAEHTRAELFRLFPRVGESFVSNRRRPILLLRGGHLAGLPRHALRGLRCRALREPRRSGRPCIVRRQSPDRAGRARPRPGRGATAGEPVREHSPRGPMARSTGRRPQRRPATTCSSGPSATAQSSSRRARTTS